MYILQNVRQNCKNLTIYTRLKHSRNQGRIADKQIENIKIQTFTCTSYYRFENKKRKSHTARREKIERMKIPIFIYMYIYMYKFTCFVTLSKISRVSES